MKAKRILVFGLGLFCGILAVGIGLTGTEHGSGTQVSRNPIRVSHEQAKENHPAPTTIAQALPTEEHPTLPTLLQHDSVPTQEQVRAQVMANPHGTPVVLLDFASHMAAFMKAALSSPEATQAAIPELKKCLVADDSEVIDSAKALCLLNLKRLAKNQSFDGLATSRVQLLAKAVETLGR